MENEFVSFEQALALKELGFDKRCFGWYLLDTKHFVEEKSFKQHFGLCLAPLYQQAFRWFRKRYNLLSFIDDNRNGEYRYVIFEKTPLLSPRWFKTYEEAEQACLDKLIEIVKNKN